MARDGIVTGRMRTLERSCLTLLLVSALACGDDGAGSGGGGAGTGGSGGANAATSTSASQTVTGTTSTSGTSTTSSTSGTGGGGDGGGQGGGGGAAPNPAADHCEGASARAQACGDEDSTVEACLADEATACLFGDVREDIREALSACLNERPCEAGPDDEPCSFTVPRDNPTDGQEDFRSSCETAWQDCGNLGDLESIDVGQCYVLTLEAEVYAELAGCFPAGVPQTCSEIGACIDAIVSAYCALEE